MLNLNALVTNVLQPAIAVIKIIVMLCIPWSQPATHTAKLGDHSEQKGALKPSRTNTYMYEVAQSNIPALIPITEILAYDFYKLHVSYK